MSYIKIDRKLFDHFLWNANEPYAPGQAWIDLIQLANYKDRKEKYNGKVIIRKRGVVICSMHWIADRWKWDRRKVKRFLDELATLDMIQVVTSKSGIEVNITNYDHYQFPCTTNSTTNGTTDSTTNGTTKSLEPQGVTPIPCTTDSTTDSTTNSTTDGTYKNKDKERNNINNIYKEKESKKEIHKERTKEKELAEAVIAYLNSRTGKHLRADTKEYVRLISARAAEDYTLEDFKKVIDNKCAEWKGTKYEEFLRPQTLFSPSKFDTYLNQVQRAASNNPFLDMLQGGGLNDIRGDGEDTGTNISLLREG